MAILKKRSVSPVQCDAVPASWIFAAPEALAGLSPEDRQRVRAIESAAHALSHGGLYDPRRVLGMAASELAAWCDARRQWALLQFRDGVDQER